ncbi:MAG: ferrous iron transporter B [Pseudobdellovibrio sp.]
MSAWVLVGSPNSGKTTLYNWLTGSKFKTVNYPGATVEYCVGTLQTHLSQQLGGEPSYIPTVIDTPGIYSLQAQSEDEKVTYSTLFDQKANQKEISGIIFVMDGTQLSRHLALANQLRQTGYPIIFVVTMVDLLIKNKLIFQLEVLKNEFNAPVILFDGLLGSGLLEITKQMKQEDDSRSNVQGQDHVSIVAPAAPVWNIQKQEQSMKYAIALANKVILNQNANKSVTKLTQRIDHFLLHPIFGIIFFLFFMTILFSSVYWMAQPVMDQIDAGFSFTSNFVATRIPGIFGDFLGKGLIAAIGGVFVFVPQIFILFFGVGVLESTGYLARVAALIDKPLSMVGLGGRSFVPLLSGFACAIPAIMATRNITSKKERLIAQSVIPFMTCSARLPVYGLMIGFLFGDQHPLLAGLIMASLYFSSLVVGAIAAAILSKIIASTQKTRLMMELPLYRKPRFKILLNQSFAKAKSFLRKAGPIILILAIVLWFATNFPRPTAGQILSDSEIAKQSYAAQVGKAIEPVFKPLGLDWRVGFGLISAFAAREVFVSALVLVFNVEGEGDAQAAGLIKSMREATFEDGSKIFTVASVVGIFIFFTIALQCISTFAILKRESGSWTPAVLQLVLSNLVAYGLAVIAVQSLKFLGL